MKTQWTAVSSDVLCQIRLTTTSIGWWVTFILKTQEIVRPEIEMMHHETSVATPPIIDHLLDYHRQHTQLDSRRNYVCHVEDIYVSFRAKWIGNFSASNVN